MGTETHEERTDFKELGRRFVKFIDPLMGTETISPTTYMTFFR